MIKLYIILSADDDDSAIESSVEQTSSTNKHEAIRRLAREQVDRNIGLIKAVMEKRGKRTVDNFSVGDIIRINIPKVDRVKLGKNFLHCKVLSITDSGKYRIGCSSGRINVCYNAADMERVSAEFPELDEIPDQIVSLTEAVRQERVTQSEEVNRCQCKSSCSTRRCSCKRMDTECSQQCHPTNRQCINK